MVNKSSDRWAVLIGINGYHESLGELSFSVNDAKLMQETLVSEACGFPEDNVLVLSDDQPEDRHLLDEPNEGKTSIAQLATKVCDQTPLWEISDGY